jgi:hypothetical protein
LCDIQISKKNGQQRLSNQNSDLHRTFKKPPSSQSKCNSKCSFFNFHHKFPPIFNFRIYRQIVIRSFQLKTPIDQKIKMNFWNRNFERTNQTDENLFKSQDFSLPARFNFSNHWRENGILTIFLSVFDYILVISIYDI